MLWSRGIAVTALFLLPLFVWGEPLQVTTFNIGAAQFSLLNHRFDTVKCRDSRIPAQLKEISKFVRPPFVLFLQEVFGDSQKLYRELARRNHYFASTPDSNGSGLMILSSERILKSEFFAFSEDTYAKAGIHRGILLATIRHEGKNLTLMDIHTSSGDRVKPYPIHQSQLKEIAGVATEVEKPLILAGDFNMGENVHFKNEKYDPPQVMWHESFLNFLEFDWQEAELKQGLYSRDEVTNPVTKHQIWYVKFEPTKWSKTWPFIGGGWQWPKQSTIDHIFMSHDLTALQKSETVLGLTEALKGCPKDKNKKSALSDHYGVMTYVD